MSKKPQRQPNYDDDQAILSDVVLFDEQTRIVISLYGDSEADNLAANNLYRKICQLIDHEMKRR
jgi:hypothetical protein